MMPSHKNTQGFTLLEMAISVAILALLSVGGMAAANRINESTEQNITKERMEMIKTAMVAYLAKNDVLPCPADSSLPINDAGFGLAEVGGGSAVCQDNQGGAGAEIEQNSAVYHGTVPTRTLGLPDEYAFDAWGNKFSYVIPEDYMDADSTTFTSDSITLTADGNNLPSGSNIVYLLISHGKNGFGAYTRNGTLKPSTGATTEETDNIQANLATNLTFDKFLISTDGFDDIVHFTTRNNLIFACRFYTLTCTNAKFDYAS